MIKNIELNDGNKIPQIGLGVYLIWDYEECKNTVLNALKCGYRSIDTAMKYQNEQAVGDAIKESNIKREEIFITTKIWIDDYGYDKTKKAVDISLKRLSVDYIDLVLLHESAGDYINAWRALEELKNQGKIKSIGVSNFDKKTLDKLLLSAKIVPCINQIECHPLYNRKDLIKYLDERGIKTEAWFPLGHGNKKLSSNESILAIAKKHQKTVQQIILRWHIQSNHIIIPKSTSIDHLRENISLYDFELTKEEMEAIDNLNLNKSLSGLPKFLEKPFYYLVSYCPNFLKLLR